MVGPREIELSELHCILLLWLITLLHLQETDDCTYITKNTVGNLLRVDDSTFLKEMADWAQGKRNTMVPYDLMVTLTS